MKKTLLFLLTLLVFAGAQADNKQKVIRIGTEQTDLLLQVGDNGRLYQTYLGPKLVHEADLQNFEWYIHAGSDGSVSHRAVEEETAYTLYVQGIAVVAAAGIDTALISERIREMEGQGVPLAEISRAIAGMNLPAGTDVYVATFPFQTLQRIG